MIAQRISEPPPPPEVAGEPVTVASFRTNHGLEVQATVLRLTPQQVTFEVYSPQSVFRLSEVLADFKLYADSRSVYSGEAVISGVLNAGSATVCEAMLTGSLLDIDLFRLGTPEKVVPSGFTAFLRRWERSYQILREYKLAVADLQSFLQELRLWLDQVELGVRGAPSGDRGQMERNILRVLPAAGALDALFQRFEAEAASVPEELVPAHRAYCRRQLHPLLLCSPFMHRIFTKPLGYAGDYEMIDMIIRNEPEGSSLFAKLLQQYILAQAPARAVRNRAAYFETKMVLETERVSRLGPPANIFSLGCGPAREVQNFLATHRLSNHAHFELLDFNEETLAHAGRVLTQTKATYQRQTTITLTRRSVHQLLKHAGKPFAPGKGFDMIYCSGLYDYLNDRVCKSLNTYLYDQLLPGGVLIVTNFDGQNPIRHIQEHAFDWFLTYRNGAQLAGLAPEQAVPENCKVYVEDSGCNVFLEARKPMRA